MKVDSDEKDKMRNGRRGVNERIKVKNYRSVIHDPRFCILRVGI